MAKNHQIAVRSHKQEVEWLRSLGKGNLTNGVKSLIQRDADGYARKNNAALATKKK